MEGKHPGTQVRLARSRQGYLTESQAAIEDFLILEVKNLPIEVQDNTPKRFTDAFREMMGANDEPWTFTTFESTCDEMIIVKDIDFVTLCEHHLLPFVGHAHVAYLPQGVIAGLSKVARAVRSISRGLWVQENLTMAIADFLEENLQPRAIGVILNAEHTCMSIRGACAIGSNTITSAMRGAFREEGNYARAEFLSLIRD